MTISQTPKRTTKYVLLENLRGGNRFFTNWKAKDTPERICKLSDGTLAYKVLGFASSVLEAQTGLNTGFARIAHQSRESMWRTVREYICPSLPANSKPFTELRDRAKHNAATAGRHSDSAATH